MHQRKFRPVSAKPSLNFGIIDDPLESRISQDLLVTRYLENYVNDPKKTQKNLRAVKRFAKFNNNIN